MHSSCVDGDLRAGQDSAYTILRVNAVNAESFRDENKAGRVLMNVKYYLGRIATISSGGPYPRTCAVFDTQYGFSSSPLQRLELCGEPQEQYSVHPSHIPSATGARYDPFGYGLNPIR